MSDLQCAARFVLLTEHESAAALGDERVAAVYDARSGPGRAESGAERLLGLPVRRTHPLVQARVVDRSPEALDVLQELADMHRGETVVVLTDGRPGHRLDVAVDGDGVAVREVSPEGGT